MPAHLALHNITIDCADPWQLCGFWSEVMGWPRAAEDRPGDEECSAAPPDGTGPGLLFIRVPEPRTVKNRVHVDLWPTERRRDEEVERVLSLGATVVEDHRSPTGGWVWLSDPEGNDFCIERSRAER